MLSLEEVKKQFPDIYTTIENILFEHDLMGVNFVDNTDEYAPEVNTILPRLSTAISSDDVTVIIKEEFIAWFDDIANDIETNLYQEMGKDVWEAWQKR